MLVCVCVRVCVCERERESVCVWMWKRERERGRLDWVTTSSNHERREILWWKLWKGNQAFFFLLSFTNTASCCIASRHLHTHTHTHTRKERKRKISGIWGIRVVRNECWAFLSNWKKRELGVLIEAYDCINLRREECHCKIDAPNLSNTLSVLLAKQNTNTHFQFKP